MTIDITPKTILRMATGFEFDGDKTTATTLRALSSALTASQAETAAVIERAADVAWEYRETSLPPSRIRALATTDQSSALAAIEAAAEARGMRKAAAIVIPLTPRISADMMQGRRDVRNAILASIPKGKDHE